jgi:hypothetical protein
MKPRHLLPLCCFALAPSAIAAEPTSEPSDTLISRLINLRSQNRTPAIAVAMVLEGTTRSGPFEMNHVRRIITVHPVIDNGRQVRRVNTYELHWTPAYGWFLWEKREEAGGEAVWIWSELQGEVAVR